MKENATFGFDAAASVVAGAAVGCAMAGIAGRGEGDCLAEGLNWDMRRTVGRGRHMTHLLKLAMPS